MGDDAGWHQCQWRKWTSSSRHLTIYVLPLGVFMWVTYKCWVWYIEVRFACLDSESVLCRQSFTYLSELWEYSAGPHAVAFRWSSGSLVILRNMLVTVGSMGVDLICWLVILFTVPPTLGSYIWTCFGARLGKVLNIRQQVFRLDASHDTTFFLLICWIVFWKLEQINTKNMFSTKKFPRCTELWKRWFWGSHCDSRCGKQDTAA